MWARYANDVLSLKMEVYNGAIGCSLLRVSCMIPVNHGIRIGMEEVQITRTSQKARTIVHAESFYTLFAIII